MNSNAIANALIISALPKARRYAIALTRRYRQHDITPDDLVNDTVVKALEKFHMFQLGTDFQSWFNVILHNLCVNSVRQAMRHQHNGIELISMQYIGELHDCGATPDARLIVKDVAKCLDELSPEMRQVIMLASDKPSYDAMAEMTGLPVGTVRSRLSRGRAKLRMVMNQ